MTGAPSFRRDFQTSAPGLMSRLRNAANAARLLARRYPGLSDVEAVTAALAARLEGQQRGPMPDIDVAVATAHAIAKNAGDGDRRELDAIVRVLSDVIEQRDALASCVTIECPR